MLAKIEKTGVWNPIDYHLDWQKWFNTKPNHFTLSVIFLKLTSF